ncbi:MAG: glycosyltransferase family 2 protein [Bacteroidales bacterium]|jgi:glycosyltransferase involved in cell wall biosynthesis
MKIAVLIPCYNEAQTISKVVKDFKEVLPLADIYVYDNNSTDETSRIAKEAGAIVRYERKQGKGNVIRRMFREINADCYLMIDGDDTYPAKHAPELVNKLIQEDADMVIGDRLSSTYFDENKRPFHNSGNKLVRGLIRNFWETDIHDIMTGYRAFSKRFVKLFPVMSPNFEIETEMTIHALDKRFTIVEVPIEYQDRPDGSESKLNTFSDGFKVLNTIFKLFKTYRPLIFFGYFALLLFIVSIILFIPILIDYFNTGLVPRFPTLFVSLFLALAALISFFTGLFLDVLVSIDRKNFELKVIDFDIKNN